MKVVVEREDRIPNLHTEELTWRLLEYRLLVADVDDNGVCDVCDVVVMIAIDGFQATSLKWNSYILLILRATSSREPIRPEKIFSK